VGGNRWLDGHRARRLAGAVAVVVAMAGCTFGQGRSGPPSTRPATVGAGTGATGTARASEAQGTDSTTRTTVVNDLPPTTEPRPPGSAELQLTSSPYRRGPVELRVLVVTDGGPSAEAVAAQLVDEGVPFTKVTLTDPARPVLDAAFLSRAVGGVTRARFQAVVLPNDAPVGLAPTELAALHDVERSFGLRQVDAFEVAGPAVGLDRPSAPAGWSGALDGSTLTVTPDGLAGPFSYLLGPVPVEDTSPTVDEAFAYLAPPHPKAGQSFTTLVDAAVPGRSTRAPVVGVFTDQGRDELVITMAHNTGQYQDRLLAHGVVTWMTRGVHLGYYRNAYTAQVDDIFLQNSRWDPARHCSALEDCPSGVTARPIRMTADDVRALVAWQQKSKLRLDLAFNGGGSDDAAAELGGTDPVLAAFLGHMGEFDWISHTFSHLYLGCVRDTSVTPWVCTKDPATGQVRYVGQTDIATQVLDNIGWARAHGVPIADTHQVVTGEHSGLFILPQQPVDNPNLAAALGQAGISLLASDASRDPQPRVIGGATTLPRWPVEIFHDVGTVAEEVAEYNWRYTDSASGGSGYCTAHPDTTTCVTPLDPTTGYLSYIVPIEVELQLQHVLTNDPRPHYFHQDNLAEDRLLYPMLDEMLRRYRAAFAPSTPIWQPTYAESARWLDEQRAWQAQPPGAVDACVDGAGVHVTTTAAGVVVPLTAPEGTTLGSGGPFGDSYAGERSAWLAP
jgi:hypothetical protein